MRGFPCEVARSLLALAEEGQILTSRSVHDDARAMLRGEEVGVGGRIAWLDHGNYTFRSIENPLQVCEVGEESGVSPLHPPKDTEFARRSTTPEQEAVLGWRPALGNEIPTSPGWIITEKLGSGGFGEVWRACRKGSDESRIFKFCFHADRVRSLKREVTLFRIMRDRLGPHPNIVRIHDVFFERPPFYISMEDVGGLDLAKWCELNARDARFDEGLRLEIVAKVAGALQAAHDAGVIHRDLKPSNILVEGGLEDPETISIQLTDFGIGQVESQQILQGVTGLGFTETWSRTELTSGSGSRLYMAPELLVGKESSIRSDIYSLGMVLYQILLGDCNRPLTVDWERDIEDPILLEDLRGCLSGRASQRFSSAEDLATRLRSVPARRESRRRHEERTRTETHRKRLLRGATTVAALAVVLAAFLGYGLRQASIERESLEHSLYQLGIEEARRSIEEEDPTRARKLLLASPERFRGWEWGYLACKCNTDHRCFSHASPIVALELSADNRFLATGDSTGGIRVWDFHFGELVWDIQASSRSVESISINKESNRLASSDGHDINVFDLTTKERLAVLHPRHALSGGMQFAPQGSLLAAADSEGTLLLYDLVEESTRTIVSGHAGRIIDFDFLPDGSHVISIGKDGACRLLDIQSGEQVAKLEAPTTNLSSMAIRNDGGQFVILSENQLYLGRTDPFELTGVVYQVGGYRGSVCWSPNGRYLGMALDNHRTEIVDLETMASPWRRGGAGGHARSLAFTADGRFLLTLDEDGKARQRPIRTGGDGTILLMGHSGWVHCVRFSPDGKTLATGSEDMTVSLWDTKSGGERFHLPVYSAVQCLAWSPSGNELAGGGESGDLFVWDSHSGRELRRFKAHEGTVTAVEFHPSGASIATKGIHGDIAIWSLEDGSRLRRIDSQADAVLAYTPDGKGLIHTGEDFSIRESSLESGISVVAFLGHKRPVRKVIVFPSGNRVASCDEDGEVILWDRKSGERIATLRSRVSLTHELIVTSDEKRLITSIEIWDLENFRPIMPIPVEAKALSRDETQLAIGGAPHRVRIEGAFPYSTDHLPGEGSLVFEERIEEYKRMFWEERPGTATGTILPEVKPRKAATRIAGSWDFNRSDLEATVGRSLECFGTQTKTATTYGSTREFGIPSIEDQTAYVIRFPGFPREMGLRLFSNAPQQGEDKLQAYTLLLDILYPKESEGLIRPLFNTDSSNSSPAELIVSSTGGLGVERVFHGRVEAGRWHRVACSVNLTGVPRMDTYIDGSHVGAQEFNRVDSDRWAVEEGMRGRSMLLFAGSDGDNAPCFVNSIQFRDYAMSADEIATLGGPSAEGFPTELEE
ncbi:MAG: protein kinase [Candidatus Omnitrophica bacterium]|nr:protein kinase [Candidatus Omnitrophota bacterium]